jgi:hypothetical protein
VTAITFESDRAHRLPALVLGDSCLPVRQSGNSWTDVTSFLPSTMSEPASVVCVMFLVAFHNADDLHHTAQRRTSLTRTTNCGNVTVFSRASGTPTESDALPSVQTLSTVGKRSDRKPRPRQQCVFAPCARLNLRVVLTRSLGSGRCIIQL